MDDHVPGPRARRLAALVRVLTGLPEPLYRLVRGRSPVNDRGDRLAPDLTLVCRFERLQPVDLPGLTPERARRRLVQSIAIVEGPELPVATVDDLKVDGGRGPIDARVYGPIGGADRLLVYLHGGGWVVGDLRTHDRACRRLAAEGRQVVLSVHYGRAPEHPFPQSQDDALAAFRWARREAASFGVDPARVAVGGDSAGGNLAAAVALRLRELGEAQPAFQLLIYPAVDLRRQTASYHLFGEGYLLTKQSMDWYLDRYGAPLEHPRASLILEPDLSGLAPAVVVTAGFDPLRDEGEAYAARLREAGVRVDELRFPAQVHGFLNMDALASSGVAAGEVVTACRRAWTTFLV